MPTLTLLVEDLPGRGRGVHWDGIEVDPQGFADQIAAMAVGTRFEADCRYTAEGLVLREIKRALAERGATPPEKARRLLDAGQPRESLAALRELPAGAVDTDPQLLMLRMRAHAAMGQGAKVGEDFARLLQTPGLDPADARRGFQILSVQTRPFFALRLAQWATQNFAVVQRWGAQYVLEGVPLEQWPHGLVLAELDRLLGQPVWSASLGDGSGLRPLLERLTVLAPNDPRLGPLRERVEHKLAALADPHAHERDGESTAPTVTRLLQLPPGWTPPQNR